MSEAKHVGLPALQILALVKSLARGFGKSWASKAWPHVGPSVRGAILDSYVMDHARLRDDNTKMTIADLITVRHMLPQALLDRGAIRSLSECAD